MSKSFLSLWVTATGAVAVVLSGCGATFDYEGLRAFESEGASFQAELAREYKTFALFETDEMLDWPDAAHFGNKAIRAGRGAETPPEELGEWRLPKEHIGELTAARARLIEALSQGAGESRPETAAIAQVRFDCWIEQQEENWQTEHIARCRDGYYAAIEEIEAELAQAASFAGSDRMAAALEVRSPTEPQSFIVFFTFDSAEITPAAADVAGEIAEAVHGGQNVLIAIQGHADRAGPDSYNETLSLRRAQAFGDALVARGVPVGLIDLSARGESQLMVETSDGVREPRNRRVEIVMEPSSTL